MIYTPHIELKKPGRQDKFNIDDFNENSDKIDNKISMLEGNLIKDKQATLQLGYSNNIQTINSKITGNFDIKIDGNMEDVILDSGITTKQTIQNPYVKIRGKNLLNINSNFQKTLSTGSTYSKLVVGFKPKSNTVYNLTGHMYKSTGINVNGGFALVGFRKGQTIPQNENWFVQEGTRIATSEAYDIDVKVEFNSGEYEFIGLYIGLIKDSSPCTFKFTNWMISEKNLDLDYEQPRESIGIIPTYLAKIGDVKDRVIGIKGTKAIVERRIGRTDCIPGKKATVTLNKPDMKIVVFGEKNINANSEIDNKVFKKYDGKILGISHGTIIEQPEYAVYSVGYGGLHFSLSNSDTGWGDSYTNLSDLELKAYFLGYQMNNGTYGQLYNNSGTKTWIPLGDTDNTRAVTTCPTEISPTIVEGKINHYGLFYVLETPRIEEVEMNIIGDSFSLQEGTNTVEVGTGLVYEKANPVYFKQLSRYYINDRTLKDNQFRFKTKKIVNIYKQSNEIIELDNNSWTFNTDINAYGYERLYIKHENFDPQAKYYCLYEMIPELYTCNIEGAEIVYSETIRDSLNNVNKRVGEVIVDVSFINMSLLEVADKELGMHMIELLNSETNSDLKNKVNEILNIWR
ncbi:hypothetical protein [Anaerophilus nitritogenes]|uniref:hypothetical protein n=1 Tax=Anaerophilus nitritogenes TaxID=2498136 RepID=UPI00101C1084|nr:hypothetical protein [Anaerophilus nitritogenes]